MDGVVVLTWGSRSWVGIVNRASTRNWELLVCTMIPYQHKIPCITVTKLYN